MTLEENRKRYELQQKQRYYERSLRATKRKLIEKQAQIDLITEPEEKAKLQKDYDKLAYRLTEQNKAYNDFHPFTVQPVKVVVAELYALATGLMFNLMIS